MKRQPGYIVLLTLMVLALTTTIVTQIFFQSRLYSFFIPLSLEKERARQLALSGISLAIAQLSLQDTYFQKPEDKKEEAASKPSGQKESVTHAKALLKTLLCVQGRWQTFALRHEVDGIDAELGICITCEDGKLNINQLYDFEKHEFKKISLAAPEELFKQLGGASMQFTGNKNMFEPIVEFLKKQKDPLIDVTQLLRGKALEDFKENLFYAPPTTVISVSESQKDQSREEIEPRVYLADLFTISTDSYRLNAWVLSSSLRMLLKIKPREVGNEKEFEKEMDELLEKVPIEGVNWQKDWDTYLKPIYKIEFQSLPKELVPFLSTKFEPRQFSVLCYGKVGRVTQKLLVILERAATGEGESFLVKKMYWL